MSIHHLNIAFKASLSRSSCKFILVALADYANEAGEAYPSTETICAKTSLNRKTVAAGIEKLIELGFIYDTMQRKGRTNQVRIFQLTIEKGVDKVPKNGELKGAQKRDSSKNERYPFFPTKVPKNGGLKGTQKRYIEPSVLLTTSKPPVLSHKVDFPDDINPEAWREFLSSRKKLKAQNTDYAINLLLTSLAKIRDAGFDVNEAINLAIVKGWKGLDVSWLVNSGLRAVHANVSPDSLDWLDDDDDVCGEVLDG